jgi:hypothetical protein
MTELSDLIRARAKDTAENALDPQACAKAVLAVLDMHSPYRIFNECGHEHDPVEPGLYYIDEVGLVCEDGYAFAICAHCCASDDGQTEQCASYHVDPNLCYPCREIRAIAEQLGLIAEAGP